MNVTPLHNEALVDSVAASQKRHERKIERAVWFAIGIFALLILVLGAYGFWRLEGLVRDLHAEQEARQADANAKDALLRSLIIRADTSADKQAQNTRKILRYQQRQNRQFERRVKRLLIRIVKLAQGGDLSQVVTVIRHTDLVTSQRPPSVSGSGNGGSNQNPPGNAPPHVCDHNPNC